LSFAKGKFRKKVVRFSHQEENHFFQRKNVPNTEGGEQEGLPCLERSKKKGGVHMSHRRVRSKAGIAKSYPIGTVGAFSLGGKSLILERWDKVLFL